MCKLSALYARYRRMVFDGKKGVPKYSEVKKEDLDFARELLDSIDVNSILEELEECMSLDKKKNAAAYNIWKYWCPINEK